MPVTVTVMQWNMAHTHRQPPTNTSVYDDCLSQALDFSVHCCHCCCYCSLLLFSYTFLQSASSLLSLLFCCFVFVFVAHATRMKTWKNWRKPLDWNGGRIYERTTRVYKWVVLGGWWLDWGEFSIQKMRIEKQQKCSKLKQRIEVAQAGARQRHWGVVECVGWCRSVSGCIWLCSFPRITHLYLPIQMHSFLCKSSWKFDRLATHLNWK